MSSDEKQQAVQTASEKLDRLIEATEQNGKYLRQIRRAAAWLVLLIIPVPMTSCESLDYYVRSRYGVYQSRQPSNFEDREVSEHNATLELQPRIWGMVALFGIFLVGQIAIDFVDFLDRRRARD